MKEVNGLKLYTHEEIKDQIIGKVGTPKRDAYEFNLEMELIGNMIKEARKKRNLTQEELGELIGVQKAQISKLERSAKNVTFATVFKVFEALDAKLTVNVELLKKKSKAPKP